MPSRAQEHHEGNSPVRRPLIVDRTACMQIGIEPRVSLSPTGLYGDQAMRCEKDRQRRTSSHAFGLVSSPHVLVAMMTVEHSLGETSRGRFHIHRREPKPRVVVTSVRGSRYVAFFI